MVPVPFDFVCPACAAAQTTNLFILARSRAIACTACARKLTIAHVMRARATPREMRK